VLVIPGALAVIYGDDVSRALATIDTVSRAMGVALLAGGITTITGIARGRSLVEVIGLSLLAVGCGIYGLGVFLGLGFAGAVAGSGFLASPGHRSACGDPGRCRSDYSHSIVPGGLLVTSSTTRLISGTSLVIRPEMRARTS
jgi:hypothetical protein